MIASFTHGFAVLANPKTGSTTLERTLKPYTELALRGRWKHANYFRLRRVFGEDLLSRFEVYTLVRDPVDTLLSWYRYRAREELARHGTGPDSFYTGGIGFGQFVDEWERSATRRAGVTASVDFCFSPAGQLAPTRYYRYAEFARLVGKLEEHVGGPLRVADRNMSPKVTVEFDREQMVRRPKLAALYALQAQIPFQ